MSTGMTLRDYFAAAALTGLVSKANLVPGAIKAEVPACAEIAYALADAMLAARDAKGGA